ncbi:hypothetical protein SUDANB21_04398 [Streptomyces sp. enrichment culture]|jgi:hypothetical protein|uniref:Uncharacterized protein n=1 Tax=Streptomyces variabilis TaxID=67372 RepID=A0ABQ2U774_9ACTN|nr:MULTISPECIES: hypothetical protein [Streptomyces]RMI89666.1 hypothetical protein BIU87_30255 [Streptomyces sp. ZS0098]WTB88929.1 hypothetical protein OIE99_12060 [Streptomyces cellulosae]GGP53839.1 hypothetical protein GCM10010265_34860 [Streptomyces griseoincarnatus]MDH3035697.1 hypothetical protein [Streptomyces sp. TRM75561]WTC56218.1 hypothetical protein OH715_13400 [Streptomyces cellulosae]
MNNTDSEFVRQSIWEHVPEARPFITELEQEELELTNGECSDPGMYSMLSYGFIHPVFRPALEKWAEETIVRSARLIETLLGSGRPQVIELVSIRITDLLLGFPELWERFASYAGPHMQFEADLRRKYYR